MLCVWMWCRLGTLTRATTSERREGGRVNGPLVVNGPPIHAAILANIGRRSKLNWIPIELASDLGRRSKLDWRRIELASNLLALKP
jgi:hypothetical protein